MAASFPTQNSHSREATGAASSVLASLSGKHHESELITLSIPSDDWSRASISMDSDGNGRYSSYSFERMVQDHMFTGTPEALDSNTTSLQSYISGSAIDDSSTFDLNASKTRPKSGLFLKGPAIISENENQLFHTVNPQMASYFWHKDMINTQNSHEATHSSKFMQVYGAAAESLNSDSNLSDPQYLQYYQAVSAHMQQYPNAYAINYQPFALSHDTVQTNQQFHRNDDISEKLFNSKEETVVGWWLNELGQLTYQIPKVSQDFPTNSVKEDLAIKENDSSNNFNGHQYPVPRKEQYDSLAIESMAFLRDDSDVIKKERKCKQSEDQKRSNHLASERKRRANYKNALNNLSNLIPKGSGAESQSCLIWKAINFIRSLEQTNNMLRFKLNGLMNRY